jgi:hypothetical protein
MSKTDDKAAAAAETAEAQEAPKGDDILAQIDNLSPEALEALASRLKAMQAAEEPGDEDKTAELERKAQQDAETARMSEPVPVMLFKDNDKYKDDLFVGWNGTGYRIKRGITVMVPRAVANIVQQQLDQDNSTAQLITEQAEKFAEEVKAL